MYCVSECFHHQIHSLLLPFCNYHDRIHTVMRTGSESQNNTHFLQPLVLEIFPWRFPRQLLRPATATTRILREAAIARQCTRMFFRRTYLQHSVTHARPFGTWMVLIAPDECLLYVPNSCLHLTQLKKWIISMIYRGAQIKTCYLCYPDLGRSTGEW